MEEVVALEAAEGSEAKEDSVEGTIGPSIDVTASGIILLLGSALQLLSVFGILLVWTLPTLNGSRVLLPLPSKI